MYISPPAQPYSKLTPGSCIPSADHCYSQADTNRSEDKYLIFVFLSQMSKYNLSSHWQMSPGESRV